jgi:hypothetical protein
MSSDKIFDVTTPLPRHAPRRRSSRSGGTQIDRETGSNPGGVRGRAWINGREVGGTAPRFAHLLRGHD